MMRSPLRTTLRTTITVGAALVLGACTNGGKNLRDTTGMTPGSAAGHVGGARATTGVSPDSTAAVKPAVAGDSITSRRDTLGGRMSGATGGRMRGMMPGNQPPRARGDTTRRRP